MTSRSAFREPMVWLVVALPLAVLVAAVWTIERAAGGADASPAEVRRYAQVQTQDLAPDRAAAALGLRGELRIEPHALLLRLHGVPAGGTIRVQFEHPVAAAQDRVLAFVADGGQWRSEEAPPDETHAWNLRVTDEGGHWRLVGRMPARASVVELVPAVPP